MPNEKVSFYEFNGKDLTRYKKCDENETKGDKKLT
jgi:hypothetical protein